MHQLRIIPARLEDAPFVARCVCMALHHEADSERLAHVAQVCRRHDALYSYRHALVAWMGDEPVGLCLCYDGARYTEMRRITFPLFSHEGDAMDLDNAQDETQAGEYYLDSLAVVSQWRGRGIARQLIEAQLQRARQMGFHRATLLVDPANEGAQRLYASIGFRHHSDCYAFGQTYWKWEISIGQTS